MGSYTGAFFYYIGFKVTWLSVRRFSFVPAKLSTTVSNISKIANKENAILIHQFYEFMQENGT
jgi:hypothetical protein